MSEAARFRIGVMPKNFIHDVHAIREMFKQIIEKCHSPSNYLDSEDFEDSRHLSIRVLHSVSPHPTMIHHAPPLSLDKADLQFVTSLESLSVTYLTKFFTARLVAHPLCTTDQGLTGLVSQPLLVFVTNTRDQVWSLKVLGLMFGHLGIPVDPLPSGYRN